MSTMNEQEYLDLLERVLLDGENRDDRTGTGTRAVFGESMEFDLKDGFPLLTTKKMQWKSIVGELLWFTSGSTNAFELRDKYGVKIWLPWADSIGELGPVYGRQLRGDKHSPDQLADVIKGLRDAPHSRRHVISLWQPRDLPYMALPPCHGVSIQFYVNNYGGLSCQMMQRSADAFLGLPFNIASYALLTHLVAAQTGTHPNTLRVTVGDTHIYHNHIEQVTAQLSRTPKTPPKLVLDPAVPCIDEYEPESIEILEYDHHPAIKAEVSV